MSRFLSLKLLATVGFKSRAVTKFRAAAATGARSNLVRHFSLGQALGVKLVEPTVVNYKTDNLRKWNPNVPSPRVRPSIAVILSGCGFRDGTDVHEAVYTMTHLHRHKIKASLFASTGIIKKVMNHSANSDRENHPQACGPRYMLNESGRMVCGFDVVNDLENLRVEDHQGLIVPGGGGLFRNLTDYYRREPHESLAFNMDETLNHKLLDFYRHRKPMGFSSDASILAIRVFHGVRVTLWDITRWKRLKRAGIIDHILNAAEKMGAIIEDAGILEVFHDTNYNIFSTRASVVEPLTYYHVSQSIGNLVDQMVRSIHQHN